MIISLADGDICVLGPKHSVASRAVTGLTHSSAWATEAFGSLINSYVLFFVLFLDVFLSLLLFKKPKDFIYFNLRQYGVVKTHYYSNH